MSARQIVLVVLGALAFAALIVTLIINPGSIRGVGDNDGNGGELEADDGWLPTVFDEDGSVATIIADNVVILDENPGSLLGARTTVDGTFVSLELREGLEVEIGTILVSGPVEAFAPSGFILEVLDIEAAIGGSRTISVGPAGLEDVFLQADIRLTGETLIVSDESPESLVSGVTSETIFTLPVSSAPGGPLGLPVLSFELCSPVSLDVTGDSYEKPGSGIGAAVDISARPCVAITFDLSLQIRQRVEGGGRVSSMDLAHSLSTEIALDLRMAAYRRLESPNPNFRWTATTPLISGITPNRVVMVGPVPVVFQFQMQGTPSIELDGMGFELATTLRFDIEQQVSYRSQGGWSASIGRPNRPEVTGSLLPVIPWAPESFTVDRGGVDVRVRGEIQVTGQLVLYGIAGPEFRAKPGVEGVVRLTPRACPGRTIRGDIPLSFGVSISRLATGSYARMFSWITDVDLSLPTVTLGSSSWPKNCARIEHRSTWTGIGGAVADIVYYVGPIDLIYTGAFGRQVGAGSSPESRLKAVLVFDLSAEMSQDLSAVPENFGFTLDGIIRSQLCDAIEGGRDDVARVGETILLVDPVTQEIEALFNVQSGPARETEALEFSITGYSRDDNDACNTLSLEFEDRMMWIEVDLEVAERIKENGVRIVLAPTPTFFPAFATFDFLGASPQLWERQDWTSSVGALPTLRPE